MNRICIINIDKGNIELNHCSHLTLLTIINHVNNNIS